LKLYCPHFSRNIAEIWENVKYQNCGNLGKNCGNLGKNCGNLGKKSNIKSAEIWENNAEIWQLQDLLAEIWQLIDFFILRKYGNLLRKYECHPQGNVRSD
jgi:hypothetical protein